MANYPPGKTRREAVSGLLVVGATGASPVAAADQFKFGLTPVFLTNDLQPPAQPPGLPAAQDQPQRSACH